MRQYDFLHLLTHWIFWNIIPTVKLHVKWPVSSTSADPNDHYRPWLEQNIGRQGLSWDWSITGNDVADNCLTLKIRQDKAKYAIIAAMQWS